MQKIKQNNRWIYATDHCAHKVAIIPLEMMGNVCLRDDMTEIAAEFDWQLWNWVKPTIWRKVYKFPKCYRVSSYL